jgi:CSLREA domain-containing protein
MAIFTVTTAADTVNPSDGQLSLREAVDLANATTTADTIEFAPAIEGQTLVLTGGELVLTRDVTIHGGGVTLDGNDTDPDTRVAAGHRILNITGSGTDVSLDNLTLTRGSAGDIDGSKGGAILLGGGARGTSQAGDQPTAARIPWEIRPSRVRRAASPFSRGSCSSRLGCLHNDIR